MDLPALTAFLAELALHNEKPWFEEHLADEIVAACQAMFPMIRWLREALIDSGDIA